MLNNEKYQTLQLLDSRVAGTQASGSTGRTKPHQQGQSIRYGKPAVASAIYSCLHELLTVSTGAACSHAAFLQQGTVLSLEGFSRVYQRTKLHSKNTMVHKQITSWRNSQKESSNSMTLGSTESRTRQCSHGCSHSFKKVMGVLCLFKLYSTMKLWSLTQTVMAMISQLDKRFS